MNENDFDPFNNGDKSGRIDLSKEEPSVNTPPEFPYTNEPREAYDGQPSMPQSSGSQQQVPPPPPPPPPQPMYQDFGRGHSLNQSGSVPPAYIQDPSQQYYQQNGYQQQNSQGYGQQYQQPYAQGGQYQAYGGQNPYAGYDQNQSGLATASLVLGIISVVGWLVGAMFPLLLAVPAVGLILGIVHKTKHVPEGNGKSTAGIILSAIGLLLPIIAWILIIALLPNMIEYLKETDPEAYQDIYDQYADQLPGFFSALFSAMIK